MFCFPPPGLSVVAPAARAQATDRPLGPRSNMLPRHLPAVLSCLIAALLVQWAIRRWPQRSAGKPAAAAALVAMLDEQLATQDWDGAYAAWGSVLKEAHAPGVPGSIRRARIEVAHKVARARIDRMDADFRAGFPLSSTPPYSSPTFEVVVGALRGAAIFARVDEAEALLLRALKERPFAEIAESVCQGHSNSKKSLPLKAALASALASGCSTAERELPVTDARRRSCSGSTGTALATAGPTPP